MLTWGNGKFTKTVPLSKDRNVAVMSTELGIKKFTAFAAEDRNIMAKIGGRDTEETVALWSMGSAAGIDKVSIARFIGRVRSIGVEVGF
jgi:hypothetical protein